MNVASLELCQELFELSKWDDTRDDWLPDKHGKYEVRGGAWYNKHPRIPAYDLGYLLRKLPQKGDSFIHKCDTIPVKYLAIHEGSGISASSNTPEDAICKLAIELFRQQVYL